MDPSSKMYPEYEDFMAKVNKLGIENSVEVLQAIGSCLCRKS